MVRFGGSHWGEDSREDESANHTGCRAHGGARGLAQRVAHRILPTGAAPPAWPARATVRAGFTNGTPKLWRSSVICGCFAAMTRSRLRRRPSSPLRIHTGEHLSFLITALMFWSIVIEPSGRRRLGYGATFLFVAGMAVVSAMPGALLALA
jgi:hypothetical protein